MNEKYSLFNWKRIFRLDLVLVFMFFSLFYVGLAYIVSGPHTWWFIDVINGSNVFYGDDAYRFFLARSAWLDSSLYTYNFDLPVGLMLDGIVTSLSGGDLLGARCIHAVLGALGLCFVLDAGLRLGVGRVIMVSAVIMMGLIPRYAFTTLSFYGEFWLGFFISLLLWLCVTRHILCAALVASILPLIRPEGIYFWAFLMVFMLKKGFWKPAMFMLVPGVVYASFLAFSLPDITQYGAWRFELRKILEKLVLVRSKWEITQTYSLLLVFPAAFGLLYRPARCLWPLFWGAMLLILFLLITVFAGLAGYEERYTYGVIPVLVVLWASFLAWLWEWSGEFVLTPPLKVVVVLIFTFAVVLSGMRQLTFLSMRVEGEGLAWVVKKMLAQEWEAIFPRHDSQARDARKEMVKKIYLLLWKDRGIDKLVVFDPALYYLLDPHEMPAGVTIGYPSTSYAVFHLLLNGQILVQHSRLPMFTYLRFGKPDFHRGERRVLYVDLMPLQRYPYDWKWPGLYYDLYMFSYLESRIPDVNVEAAPMIYPEEVDRLYRQWAVPSM